MSFTYDNANRIVTMLQGTDLTTYSFDANGNQTVENKSGAITTNVFDNENRLILIQFPADLPSTYTYSGGGGLRRTANEKGAGVATTIWDGDDYLGEY